MNCLIIKKVNGVEVTQFNPSPTMRLFALAALCDPECIGQEPDDICKRIGIGKTSYRRFQEFNPYFEEWFEEMRLAIGGKSKRALLEMVGLEKAMNGEFNFWKAMAIKEGVIASDQLNVGINIPANLGAMKEMTDAELSGLENSIMASLRGQADNGTIDMAEGPNGWEREGDQGGATQVPGSLVLADELGADGERALRNLEHF